MITHRTESRIFQNHLFDDSDFVLIINPGKVQIETDPNRLFDVCNA